MSSDQQSKPWLSNDDWTRVQQAVPIACVDVVPVQRVGPAIGAVGLIHRDAPGEGRRWCVVGGRLWRDESLAEAVARQLHETLGAAIKFSIAPEPQPDFVVTYFTRRREIGLVDPRQHALTLNFVVAIEGPVTVGGEAFDFRWFGVDELPAARDFGFGQKHVVRECLGRRGVAVPP